nr:hypothetical protein Iba_chr10dCG7930 [Ipomoea batatas]
MEADCSGWSCGLLQWLETQRQRLAGWPVAEGRPARWRLAAGGSGWTAAGSSGEGKCKLVDLGILPPIHVQVGRSRNFTDDSFKFCLTVVR